MIDTAKPAAPEATGPTGVTETNNPSLPDRAEDSSPPPRQNGTAQRSIKSTSELAAWYAEQDLLRGPGTYYTPAQIAAITPDAPDWIVEGFIARGAITEIDGKVKTSGKTTLILDMLRSILTGADWAGFKTTKSKVVYLSEQNPTTFHQSLQRAFLSHIKEDLHIRFRNDMTGETWEEAISKAIDFCTTIGADTLVIDTVAKLAGIENENDSHGWQKAIGILQDATANGLAVIMARHSRKADGETGDTGRGSSAASGDVDIILDLRRLPGQNTTRRSLTSEGRYDLTPAEIIIDLTVGGYVYLGQERDVSIRDTDSFLLFTLGEAFEKTGLGMTVAQLEPLGADAIPPISLSAINRGLRRGVNKDLTIIQEGEGKSGHPFTYRPVTTVATDKNAS
jgi:hypothetical protein